MKFTEWFDPCNLKHIEAYKYLRDKGFWPKGFIPDDVEMDGLWTAVINSKMADLWIEYAMKGVIPGIPASDKVVAYDYREPEQ